MRFSCTFVLFLVALSALTGTAQEPAFEVASIRPSTSAGAPDITPMADGRLTTSRATVRSLILRAFSLHDSQLVGAPAWTADERFDIDARAAAAPAGGPEMLMPMLRALLASRFTLRTHPEMRELPAYLLVHARKDRALGPLIRPTQVDCSRPTVLTDAELIASAREGWPPCGQVSTISSVVKTDSGAMIRLRIRRSGITMKDFVTTFEGPLAVGRPVIDRTGLEGRFDVEYSFSPSRPQAGQSAPPPEAPPTLLIALEEQLGLKLEAERAGVPVLVVDAVERPTEN
jgi:uncharacterized protein (TIGR03435 family)